MPPQSSRLVFFTSESHFFLESYSVLSLTLVGSLTRENRLAFLECANQILQSDAKWIILNFRDVDEHFDPEYVQLLGDLVLSIRKKGSAARMSGLHPGIRRQLLERELVAPDELTNNLAEALESIPSATLSAA